MTKPFVIPKALVWEAFQRVKANGGSAGVDNESIEEFEKSLGDNLYKLWNRMGSGSYLPPPVKAVPIPKKSGVRECWACPQSPIGLHKRWSRWSSSLCSSRFLIVTHLAIGRGDQPWTRWRW